MNFLTTALFLFVGAKGILSLEIPTPEEQATVNKRQHDPIPSNFKRRYVKMDGSFDSRAPYDEKRTIEVYGGPATSEEVTDVAAEIVGKMTRHMSNAMFLRVAQKAKLGIFNNPQEKITIYPAMYIYKNPPSCGARCDGSRECKNSCSFDGRKLEDITGLNVGYFSAVSQSKLMCTGSESSNGMQNTVVHEFAHAIESQGLTPSTKRRVIRCYNDAKRDETWTSPSYAMSNYPEYWAVASQVYMGVIQMGPAAGGMDSCGKNWYNGFSCNGFRDGRDWLKRKDPCVYNILVKTWTNGDENKDMELSNCPEAQVGGSSGSSNRGQNGGSCQNGEVYYNGVVICL